MPPPRFRPSDLLAYLATPILVAGGTWGLREMQMFVAKSEHAVSLPRPFGIGYILVVAGITAIGGVGPGILSLLLSIIALVYFLTPPHFGWSVSRPRDWVEVLLVLLVGATVIYTVYKVRKLQGASRKLLQTSEQAEARLRAVMDATPVGVVTCDATGTLDYANPEAERIWGHSLLRLRPEEWGRYRFLDKDGTIIPPEKMGLARALAGTDAIIRGESLLERPDGSRVWTDSSSTRIVSPDTHELLGAVSAFIDVSVVKEAEARLRLSEENYRFLTEWLPQIVWTAQPDGSHDYFNARWFEYTGQTLDETQGWAWTRLLHPDDRQRIVSQWKQSVMTGDDFNTEYRILRSKDQTYRWFLGQARAQRSDEGQITGWFGTLTDVHDQWQAQQERERLLEEDAQRARREALLNRIGQVQRGTLDPDAISAVATRELGHALDADRCYLTAFDFRRRLGEVSPDWYLAPWESLQGEYRLDDLPISYDTLFANGKTLVVEDCRTHPLLGAAAKSLVSYGIVSLLAVPVYEGDLLVGSLSVAGVHPRAWGPDEIELAEAVAAQTRTTMEVASLLWREHNIAERLQEALTPSLPSDVPGLKLAQYYQAALREASVGGDFFDVFLVAKNRVALVMGDLSGKGLSAASQVATVRNMLRFALYTHSTLAEALTQMNTVFAERELLSGFATLWIGVFDAEAGTLTYVSAGHEPGLIRQAATNTIQYLGATGPVLGAVAKTTFSQQRLPLSPGDVLVLYTDGLSEAGRTRRNFLGVEGLAALLHDTPAALRDDPEAITAYLVAGVDTHAHGAIHDDRCVLTALVPPAPLPHN